MRQSKFVTLDVVIARTQIRRDGGFDPLKLFRGERKFAPAFEELARTIAWVGESQPKRIRSIQIWCTRFINRAALCSYIPAMGMPDASK